MLFHAISSLVAQKEKENPIVLIDSTELSLDVDSIYKAKLDSITIAYSTDLNKWKQSEPIPYFLFIDLDEKHLSPLGGTHQIASVRKLVIDKVTNILLLKSLSEGTEPFLDKKLNLEGINSMIRFRNLTLRELVNHRLISLDE